MLVRIPEFEHFEKWKLMVVAIIAVTHPFGPEAACELVAQRAGIKGVTATRLCKDVRQMQDTLQDAETAKASAGPQRQIRELWTDLLVAIGENFVVPATWVANKDGVFSASGEADILPPMLISGVLRHVNSDELLVDLHWRSGDKWRHRQVPRSTIADRRKIVDLADFGLAVNSNNAAEVVRYLADFERENAVNIEES